MNNRERENFIMRMFQSGFKQAADSFSKLTGDVIPGAEAHYSDGEPYLPLGGDPNDEVIILTTQIIGGISGKSYLVLTARDCAALSGNLTPHLKEPYLLEVDNIVSAAVISEIANFLDIEVYGDVPQLHRVPAGAVHAFIRQEMVPDEPVYHYTFFEMSKGIRPVFLWKLSAHVYQAIPAEKLVA